MSYTKSIRRKEPPPYRKEVYGLLFFAIGFFVSLSLFSYHATDPGFNSASARAEIANFGGIVGAYLADLLLTSLGLCAYVTAAVAFLASCLKFKEQGLNLKLKSLVYYLFLLAFTATLFDLHFSTIHISGQAFAGGGVLGSFFGQFLVRYLNPIGAEIVVLTGLVLFFTLATQLKISSLAINGYRLLSYFGFHLAQWSRVTFERSKKGMKLTGIWLKGQFLSMFGPGGEEEKAEVKIHKPKPLNLVPVPTKPQSQMLAQAQTQANPATSEEGPKIFERADTEKKSPKEHQLQFLKVSGHGFNLPPVSLLDPAPLSTASVNDEVLKKNAQLLENKLKDYDVEGRVTEIHPGPVVTMYELEPVPGTKVNKIVNLESDLSLTMGGKSIRIVPHLPGKAALGIEIPNHEREIVHLREIIESPAFLKSKSSLSLGLGKDIEGRPQIADLTKMPHLLIAGATGAGKSVALHSMIISMLYKTTPEEVRLILVDPKRLELNAYDGVPHLLLPVVTEPKQAVAALKWALKEMERRYKLLADVGTRNILGYNEKIKQGLITLVSEEEAKKKQEENKEALCHTGKLFYIVIIIDELADMMMIASREFEEMITRLAQMARAAGIHMILATQRPSVDVITGLIKANFPTRISFKVSARHDSRTILDQIGAETLLGAGDMLFMPPNGPNLVRIHGSLVTEAEVARVVTALKEQGEPVFDISLLETPAEEANGLEEFDEEDGQLYDMALRLVAETKQASISMIQRRLRIGYNRAARMIEKMEAEGVIGPADGAKPRQVLVGPMENL